jgi:hypothetical protein
MKPALSSASAKVALRTLRELRRPWVRGLFACRRRMEGEPSVIEQSALVRSAAILGFILAEERALAPLRAHEDRAPKGED